MAAKTTTVEITADELKALVERVQNAIDHELALSVEDMKLLLIAIQSLSTLQNKISDNSVTLHQLRKLLGMVQQSERRRAKKDSSNSSNSSNAGKNNQKKKPRDKKPPAEVEHHKLQEFSKGQMCSECQIGKLYKFEPAKLLRVTGHSPFSATQHISERLRCNACQALFTAKLPPHVLKDGQPNQKYGYSARALMGLHKFYSGVPYYHQESLSTILNNAISASTVFDQCEHLANSLMPVCRFLKKTAANSKLFLLDDTHHRILAQKAEIRPVRSGKGSRKRTGVYASGLIAYTADQKEIVLFDISLGHAGELIDDILQNRSPELAPPVVMSDALSHNTPTVTTVEQAYCNSHCRRNFFDLQKLKPDKIDYLLDQYGKIWVNEKFTKTKKLTADERLKYHQEHSKPIMDELYQWATAELQAEAFEENTAYGKAIQYLLRHFEKLTLFCRLENVPIDNNRMEETLKLVIRNRKTAHFFKTINGAGVANVITTVIGTAKAPDNQIN